MKIKVHKRIRKKLPSIIVKGSILERAKSKVKEKDFHAEFFERNRENLRISY